MSASAAEDADHCPRCGGGFHCGMNDAGRCPCSTVSLSPDLQAALRQRFSGCLCLCCLQALTAGAPLLPDLPTPAALPAT